MDKNNKILSDLVTVGKAPKKKRGNAAMRRADPQRPAARSMTLSQWVDLTTSQGSGGGIQQEERKRARAGEQCTSCNRYRITQTNPASECTLCRLKVCCDCKTSSGINALKNHKVKEIATEALNGNEYEKKLLLDYLKEKKIRLNEVLTKELSEMESNRWTYKNNLNTDVILTRDDEICAGCFSTVWNDFVYRYREGIQSLMPGEVKKRQNCWYGKECTTQTHNPNHAKNFNHICNKRPDK